MIGRGDRASSRIAYIALFVIFLQVIVSAYHVHALDLRKTAPRASAKIVSVVQASGERASPAGSAPPGESDPDDCLICTVLHLATASLLPATSGTLVLPVAVSAYEPADSPFALPPTPYRLFHTRAPPVVAIGFATL